MLRDEEKEIFNNLKEYMQSEINKGYHKFIYNDLDWDFKCIDCINAIDKVLKQSKEIEELKAINKMQKYRIEVIDEREFISKDTIKAKIEEKFLEAKGLYERGVQLQAQYTMKILRDLEKSLLQKE